jgi:cell division protein ZapA (FtsZ GTPase activity inhibitor)
LYWQCYLFSFCFGVGLASYPVEENIMDTQKKVQAILDKAAELAKKFPGMSQTELIMCAGSIMTTDELIRLKERAEKIDAFLEAEQKHKLDFGQLARNTANYFVTQFDARKPK